MGNQGLPAAAAAHTPDEREVWRPRLAKDLFLDPHLAFGEIVQRYNKIVHIIPLLREPQGGRSVEQVLEGLLAESEGYPERLREFAAVRYYLCEMFTLVSDKWSTLTAGATNYAALVGDILQLTRSNEQVCLVTFNYDLLLEQALYTFGFNRSAPEGQFDSHPVLKLFKLHGSVDWSRLADAPAGHRMSPQQLIESIDSLTLTDNYVLANAGNPHQMFTYEKPLFPAIAIPTETKTQFECPPSHLNLLANMLKSVSKILIVGWQAKEAHFLEMLRGSLLLPQRVGVVGGDADSARKTLAHFLKEIGQDEGGAVQNIWPNGFSRFVLNRDVRKFLTA